MEKKRGQVVLRGNATESGIAAELLVLLEDVAADGVITDAEIRQLQLWLNANRDSGLPSIIFLHETIEQILEDGKVSNSERRALHQAIERVLPKELREVAKAVRSSRELLEKARIKEEREEAARERKRNRPVLSLNFMVRGVGYEGRAEIIDDHLAPDDHVFLVSEPENAHDKNAVMVVLRTREMIGYVPRDDAPAFSKLLNAGFRQVAYCTKILEGRYDPIPVIQARLYEPEATVDGALSPDEIRDQMESTPPPLPSQLSSGKTPGCGCGGCAAMVAVVITLMMSAC